MQYTNPTTITAMNAGTYSIDFQLATKNVSGNFLELTWTLVAGTQTQKYALSPPNNSSVEISGELIAQLQAGSTIRIQNTSTAAMELSSTTGTQSNAYLSVRRIF